MTEPIDKVLTFKEQTVLEQMRQNHRYTISLFESLDNKASTTVSVSSIIITIITGFQLAGVQQSKLQDLWPILILYVLTLLFAFLVLFPKDTYVEPIKANWDDIRDALKDEDDTFYYRLLSGYELSILRNSEINVIKARYVRYSFISLGVTVVAALLLSTR